MLANLTWNLYPPAYTLTEPVAACQAKCGRPIRAMEVHMKKFAIRENETVKTTAAFYDCRICFPLCEFFPEL